MRKYIIVIGSLTAFIFAQAIAKESDPMAKETLGELLFSDPILSRNHSISCASCHKPKYAFADTSAVSIGVDGKKGVRNTPTAMNLSLGKSFFWDGRAKTLEEQALAPIENPNEMNLPVEEAVQRLNKDKKYKVYFKEVFNSEPSGENLGIAIAA
jgi:cytochrome c peroxidase